MAAFVRKPTPFQMTVVGFAALILIGAVLLCLPFAQAGPGRLSFLDALFTSTSAVTTTGLVVVETGRAFSLFGQMVILALFQVGGLGYMIVIALVVLGLGGRLSIGARILLRESLSRPTRVDMLRFVRVILFFTIFWEGAGTLALAWLWRGAMSPAMACYQGFFHAVSAYCTAGFSPFADNLATFGRSPAVQVVIAIVTLAGGLGFFVLYDLTTALRSRLGGRERRGVCLHSRVALTATLALIAVGSVLLRLGGVGTWWDASFQAISASTTTGFNTVPIGTLSAASRWVLTVLMFIGASPGGSGGGIKTIGFVLLLAYLRTHLRGREDVVLGQRTVPRLLINKALAIVLIAALWTVLATGVMLATSAGEPLALLFEVVSALGTVGLSTGLTAGVGATGKVVLMLSMFIGRVGPLVIGYSLLGGDRSAPYGYPEAELAVT
ncbi:MAG TPA: potassium transporter TrkG [Desulfuromonadales bacterium]|nr:potassium transporter TrkG [Desulfuromonadales bacterium]